MTSPCPRTLSKSDFILARTCDAKLWFRENGYPDNREYDEYMKLLAEGGYMVEALATARYPDGITLEYGGDPAADFDRTLEYLSSPRVTLFQATLLCGRRLARVDIIDKVGDVIRLIEVKAKSFDGSEHAQSLVDGGKGAFRGSRKPNRILETWIPKLEDVTYQTLMLERVLPGVTVQPFLALVDKSKRSALDDIPSLFEIVRRTGKDGKSRLHTARFIGTRAQLAGLDLLTEVDVSEEVALLREEVEDAAMLYEAILDAPFDPSLASRGAKCKDCEFRTLDPSVPSGFARCWGHLAEVEPNMLELFSIGTVKANRVPIVEILLAEGKASLFDIPEDCLRKVDGTIGENAERQRRQIRQAKIGERWIDPSLQSKIGDLIFPLHFVDFEVSRLALPYHTGMRPYGQVVFEWSCHTVKSAGAEPSHQEWLNTTDEWPNKAFVTALRQAIGDTDKVITWSPFEGSRLKEILRELATFGVYDPETAGWITNLVEDRIVDIHDWARRYYYHPDMRGRTSIKVVMDALWKADPIMRQQFTSWTGSEVGESEDPYHSLPPLEINGVRQDVREGTGAIRAYEAMMYGVEKTDAVAKAAWGNLLKQYCRLDTLSMVLVFEYWRRVTGLSDATLQESS
jgi:hypothetical protein